MTNATQGVVYGRQAGAKASGVKGSGRREASSPASFDEISELPESVRDSIAQMHERWNNGFYSEGYNFSKGYFEGRLSILVEFNGERPANSQVGASVWPHFEGGIFHVDGESAVWAYEFDPGEFSCPDQGDDNGVFLRIVKDMQLVDQFTRPCAVCTKADKELLRIEARRFYSITRGLVIPLELPGWKSKPSILCTSIKADQFPRGVIERGPEVVDSVREDQSETGGDWFAEFDFEGVKARTNIVIEDNFVGIALDRRFKSGLKISDVMIGPI